MTNGDWVLLRGLGRDRRHWGNFPDRLQQAFPDQQIWLPDLPGNGFLATQQSPASIAQATEYFRQWLQAQQVLYPIRILGLSMGGMIALDWLARYPHEVSRLVLVNTSMRGVVPPWKRMRPIAAFRLLLASLVSLSWREREIMQLTTRLQTDKSALLYQWCDWARVSHPRAGNLYRQLKAAADFQIAPDTLTSASSVNMFVSEQDALVNSVSSRQLAMLLRASLVVHPEAGHDLPLDAPDWLINQLQRLEQVST